jgi:predicted secreted hydrolase
LVNARRDRLRIASTWPWLATAGYRLPGFRLPGFKLPGFGSPTAAILAASPSSKTSANASEDSKFADVVLDSPLHFPQDHGAHPDFRTEWWYLTGWLDHGSQPLGFQVTFFRSRTTQSRANPSRFSAAQLLFAHVALADPQKMALVHDQRSARAGFGHAAFATDRTDLRIGDWRLWQPDGKRYQSVIRAKAFTLQLELETAAPAWLQGQGGYSRKGPQALQASYYYSRPQLSVRARLQWMQPARPTPGGPARELAGVAWLDHEWSSQVLDAQASGWDWVGLNLNNGDSLMAFQIRRSSKDVQTTPADSEALWRIASLRRADQTLRDLGDGVRFTALRWWRSVRTDISYPVEMALDVAGRRLQLKPLFDDQELDSRQSTGAIYWEGAVTVIEHGQVIGRGYLELTGYGERLRI